MKQSIIAVLTVLFVAGGCAAHYNVIDNGQVEMYLTAPQAESVVLVISGDPFREVQALRDGSGIWKVTLNQLNQFKYFYLVDGKAYLPDCPFKENDDFGSNNCIFSP